MADERFLKDAEQLLYNEWQYVLHMDKEGLMRYIFSRITEAAEEKDSYPWYILTGRESGKENAIAMEKLLTMQSTMLVLLLTGFLLAKRKVISAQFRKALTDFIINFILPCNIIKSFLIQLDLEILRDCVAVILISCATQALSIFLGNVLFSRMEEEKRPCILYATQVSNAGFLGSPIVEGLYGIQGLLYASVYLIPQRILMWSLGVACYSGTKGKGVVKKVVTHPCILAVAIGLGLMLTQLPLPEWIVQPISMVGSSNTALSLIVIGAVLAEVEPKNMFRKEAFFYCAVRLILIPAAVLGGCMLLNLDAMVTQTSVVLAGMPAALTTSILASQYGRDEKFAVSLIFLSTVGSMVTIPLLCGLMTLL